MEEILVNIDSKYRNYTMYPDESKFRLDLEYQYKNIISVGLSSIEMNNAISYINSEKDNNYFTLYLPNKKSDPIGITIELPDGLYQNIDLITDNVNELITEKINTNSLIENNNHERYFYFFYLAKDTKIDVDYHYATLLSGSTLITIKKGWYSLYGYVNIIINSLKTISTIKDFKIFQFDICVFDRRFWNIDESEKNNLRYDTIDEKAFVDSNIQTNYNNLKKYIYSKYIKDTINFQITSSGSNLGILDKIVNNTYIIPDGYLFNGTTLNSSSKYYISNSNNFSSLDDLIQTYNISMIANTPQNTITFKNTMSISYYYYNDGFFQGWQPPSGDNLLKNINESNLTFDIPTFEIYLGKKQNATKENGIFNLTNLNYPSFGYYMGFKDEDYLSKAKGTEQIITSENYYNTIGFNYVFLRLNDWGHFDLFGKKIFAKILLTSSLGYPKLDEYITKEFKFRQPNNIQKLEIELLDYLGNTIDLNGFDFSFTLELKQIIDSDLKVNIENNYINTNKQPKFFSNF